MKKLSLLLAILMLLTCAFGSLAEVTEAPTEEEADLLLMVGFMRDRAQGEKVFHNRIVHGRNHLFIAY